MTHSSPRILVSLLLAALALGANITASAASSQTPAAAFQKTAPVPVVPVKSRLLFPSTNPPAPVNPAWIELIGEYGPDQKKIYVLEKDGALCLLVSGASLIRLQPFAPGTFQLAGRPPHVSQELVFVRDASGVTGLRWKGALYPRRLIGSPRFSVRTSLIHPVDELRQRAMSAQPPHESGAFLQPDLVELTSPDPRIKAPRIKAPTIKAPTIKLDIRYATSHNFLGAPLYSEPRAYLQRPAAEALTDASKELRSFGYGLLVYDAYRPWYVTRMFWDAVPHEERIFVANPRKGSRHNRGCAVDLTLYDLKTGQPVEMTGDYDEMSERSFPTYPGGTSLARWHRDLLRQVMRSEGFTVNPYEWWHFDYKDWPRYPILNISFEALDQRVNNSRKASR